MRSLISGVIFSLFISIGTVSQAAIEVTATHRLPNPIGGTFALPFNNNGTAVQPFRIAQTFTAEVDGWLHSASVAAASTSPTPSGLSIAVTSFTGGQPGTILATAPALGVHVNGRFSPLTALNAVADFGGSQVLLEANQKYALLFVPAPNRDFFVLGDQTIGTSRNYAGGEAMRSVSGAPFVSLPIGEIVFEVTVTTIPEPTGAILLALASFGAVLRRFNFCN
jgi:hypothetical protein